MRMVSEYALEVVTGQSNVWPPVVNLCLIGGLSFLSDFVILADQLPEYV